MRIACIHLPSFPLQVHMRHALHISSLRGEARHVPAVAVAGTPLERRGGPVLIACSRAAVAGGARPGMTVAAARALSPGLVVVPRDPAAERAAIRSVAEALLAVADRVDAGGALTGAHHALYAEVPSRSRGAAFGARVQEALSALGLRARVGIADDRFTAWVAASTAHGDDDVVSVPRGGSAAYLAPQPLSLLAIDPEVQHVLGAVGVRTLGEFAALPPPSVSRPWDSDLQALARGDGGGVLSAFEPSGAIVEGLALGADTSLGAAVALVAARLAVRLAGRERGAARLRLRMATVTGSRDLELAPAQPLLAADDVADALSAALRGSDGVLDLEVEVVTEVLVGGDVAVDAAVASASAAAGVVEAEIADAPSAPLALVQPFRLESPSLAALSSAMPREPHRRTRRGKQRPRSLPAVQSRLFSGMEA